MIVASAAVLHLFFVTSGDDSSGVSIFNAGNARLSALKSKVAECLEVYRSDVSDAARMEQLVDLGMIAVGRIHSFPTEQSGWGRGGIIQLIDSIAGAASDWSVISNEEETQRILQRAFSYIRSDETGAAGTGAAFSMMNFFEAVDIWWKEVVKHWNTAQLASWIQKHNWNDIDDLWLGGYNEVSDLLGSQNKATFLRFVLMNFAKLTQISFVVM